MELIGPLHLRHDLGESPVWDGERGCLYWCDVHAGEIHAFWPPSRRHTPSSSPRASEASGSRAVAA